MDAVESRGAAFRDKCGRQGQASSQEEKHAAGGNEETKATQDRRRRHAWVGLCKWEGKWGHGELHWRWQLMMMCRTRGERKGYERGKNIVRE